MSNAKLQLTAWAAMLMISAPQASAFSIEKLRGVAVLGRPLDLNFQATVDSGEDSSSLCLEADVLQADTPVSAARTRVELIKKAGAGQSTVRVSSAVAVEEPVLTVTIRSGCTQKNSRRFVVLADPPLAVSDTSAGLFPPVVSPSISSENLTSTARRARAEPRSGVDSASGVATGTSRRSVNETAVPQRLTRSAAEDGIRRPSSKITRPLLQSQRLGSAQTQDRAGSRLRLQPIDIGADAPAGLKPSFELRSIPAESVSKRAEFAALWRVLSAQPESLTVEIERLTALQAETLALRTAAGKNRAEVARLTAELQEANDGWRSYLPWYAAGAALLLIIAAFVFLRANKKRPSSDGVWWDPRLEDGELDAYVTDVHKTTQRVEPSADNHQLAEMVPEEPTKASADVAPFTVPPLKGRSNESEFGLLVSHYAARGVNVEELFDIQQQADFFTSLGQDDQAIEVLSDHIRESAQTSPLVYLDLLKLYHRRNRRQEYAELSEQFAQLFNGEVPAFEAFQAQTRGLESYPKTLSAIEAVWRTHHVLDVIEESVFRQSGAHADADALDLEAYRELLLLHAIAKDIDENHPEAVEIVDIGARNRDPNAQRPSSSTTSLPFLQTMPQMLTPTMDASSEESSAPSAPPRPIGGRIGLDIDLSVVPTYKDSEYPETLSGELSRLRQEGPASTSGGLIEFDMDALDAEFSKIKQFKKSP